MNFFEGMLRRVRLGGPVTSCAGRRRITGPPRRTLLALLLVGSIAVGQIRDDVRIPAPSVRFSNVDIVVDSHSNPLAAYQLEFLADSSQVTLVGIEGGEHAAFKNPPYYDAKALGGGRVILAALNTGRELPSGKTRVARLHLQIKGEGKPQMSAKLVVAASSNDKTISADVSVAQGANP